MLYGQVITQFYSNLLFSWNLGITDYEMSTVVLLLLMSPDSCGSGECGHESILQTTKQYMNVRRSHIEH